MDSFCFELFDPEDPRQKKADGRVTEHLGIASPLLRPQGGEIYL